VLSETEIRAIAKTIVDKAKETAHVDQGTLKRSIAYTYVRGVVTFRQIYYGQWNENSQLEKYARDLMPYGVEWKVVLTNFGGDTYEVGTTKTGRTSIKKSLATAKRNSTKNINRLISLAIAKRKNGKEKK